MPRVKIADIVIDLSPVNTFLSAVRRDGTPTARGVRSAAQSYVKWLKARFMRNAQGGGSWEGLSERYEKRKRTNKHLILFLTSQLYTDISFKKSSSTKNPRYIVGYVHGRGHKEYPGTVRELANVHQNIGVVRPSEGGRVVTRQIIVKPKRAERNRMFGFIKRGVAADIQRANRKRRA